MTAMIWNHLRTQIHPSPANKLPTQGHKLGSTVE